MTEQIIIVVAIVFFILIGLLIKKSQFSTISDFTMNKAKLGWFPIAAGISMTYAGGAALLNMASLGMSFGWQGMVDPIGFIGGILIVIFFINKYRNDNGVTISDLLSGTDKKLSILIGIITTVVFTLILASQFVALSKLIAPIFPNVNYAILTIVPSALIFSYVFLGGFSSVTKTDIMQLVFIIVFLLLPIGYFIGTNDTITPNTPKEFTPMPLNLMILLGISLIFLPVSQDINIRAKSAVNKKQAFIGFLVGAFIYTLIIASSTYIGISLAESGIEIKDTEQAFPIFFKEFFPKFGIIAILAALAAIISSMDSFSLNAITALSNDLLSKSKISNKYSQNTLIKISGLLIYFLAIIVAVWLNESLSLILTSLLIYISTLLPIALARKLKIADNTIFYTTLILMATIISIEVLKINIELKAIFYPLIGFGLVGLSYLIITFKTTD
jgi:Na+/proline symporter